MSPKLRTSLGLVVTLFLLCVLAAQAYVPSRQARFITFSNVQADEFTVSWIDGTGSDRIVLVRQGSAPDVSGFGDNTDDNGWSAANADYSAASEPITNSGKLVYQGSGSSVTVTGLAASTTYHVMVLEYNVDGANLDFRNSTATLNPREKTTLNANMGPPTPSDPIPAYTETTATVAWDTDDAVAIGYYLDVRYYEGAILVSYDLLDIGKPTSKTFLVEGLSANTQYEFRLRSYDGQGGVSSPSDWVDFQTLFTDPEVSLFFNNGSWTPWTSQTSCTMTGSFLATWQTATYYPQPATGTWSTLQKPSGAGDPSFSGTPGTGSYAASITVDTYGEYVFEHTIRVGEYYHSSTATYNFLSTPDANAGDNDLSCGTLTYTLSGSMPTGSEGGTWSLVSSSPTGGTATFYDDNDYNGQVVVSGNGLYTFRWTVGNGYCQDYDDVDVRFADQPTASILTSSESTCGKTVSLSGSVSGGTGTWSWTGDNGTATFYPNAYSTSVTVNVPDYGTGTFYWTVNNGYCSAQDELAFTFDELPTYASVDQASDEICGFTYTLDGNTPSAGNGSWTVIIAPPDGNASFDDESSPTSGVTVDKEGEWSFAWNIGNGCATYSAGKQITFWAEPTTASAGTDGDASCGELTYQLGGNDPEYGTGTWSSSPSGASFDNATWYNATATIPSFSGNSTQYTFTWTIGNGTCSNSTDDVTITYYNEPTTASAGDDDDAICGDLTYQLAGNNPTVGAGTWTSTDPNVSFDNPNAYDAIVTVQTVDGDDQTYTFTWSIGNGNCDNSTDDVDITFYNEPTTASAGDDDEAECGSLDYTLNGNDPVYGTGTWTSTPSSGVSFDDASLYNATATIPSFSGNSTNYTFTWTIGNGNCTDSQDEVTITYYNQPTTASAGDDDEAICGTLTYQLAGNSPTVGEGTWSSSPSGASFGNANVYNTLATVPSFSGNSSTYTFTWTIGNGNCENSDDDVDITFYNTPTTASAGDDDEECGLTYSLIANDPTVGTGSWTMTGGPGTAVFTDDEAYNSSVTVSTYGTYTFTWTISNGNCSASSDALDVEFFETPSVDAGDDETICLEEAYTLQGTVSTFGTGSWSQIYGPGTASFTNVNSPTSDVEFSLIGTYTLRWTHVNGPCEVTDDVVLKVVNNVEISDPITGSAQPIAGTSNNQYSVPNRSEILSYEWSYTGTGVTINNNGNNIVNLDFSLTATDGTLCVTPIGPCGPGEAMCKEIDVLQYPVFTSPISLQSDNTYMTVNFNVGVYTNNANPLLPITPSDFELLFTKNGGTATNVTIASIKKTDGNNLTGGETEVRFYLTVTGTPNGCETIEIKPYSNAVYSGVGSEAMPNSQSTGVFNLFNLTPPTTAASNLTVPNATLYAVQATLNWTNGNGGRRIVVMSETSPVAAPADFTNYDADPQYGTGDEIGTGSFVVYDGTGSTVTVIGLDGNTEYYYAVFEYNRACNSANYLTPGTEDAFTTKPLATKLVFTTEGPTPIVTGSTFTVIVQAQDASNNPAYPACDETVTITENGSGTLSGTTAGTLSMSSTSVTISGIKYTNNAGELDVTFTADDNGCGGDLASDDFTRNVRAAEPTTHATGLGFEPVTETEITAKWNAGSGDGRILVVRQSTTSIPTSILTDGNNYSAISDVNDPVNLTSGINLGGSPTSYGMYRTYSNDAADNTIKITGLTGNTDYNFRVFEFSHAPLGENDWDTYNYKQSGFASLNPRTQKTASGKNGNFAGVEIAYFNGKSYETQVQLKWEAISEDGLTNYEIFRIDPENPDVEVKVGTESVRPSVGGSNVYTLTDKDKALQVGKEYAYRLVGVDYDGKSTVLDETMVTILSMPDTEFTLSVSAVNPNPVKDLVKFSIQSAKSAPVTIEVRSVDGKVVYSETRNVEGVSNVEFSMVNNAAGTYFITVISGDEAVLKSFVFVP